MIFYIDFPNPLDCFSGFSFFKLLCLSGLPLGLSSVSGPFCKIQRIQTSILKETGCQRRLPRLFTISSVDVCISSSASSNTPQHSHVHLLHLFELTWHTVIRNVAVHATASAKLETKSIPGTASQSNLRTPLCREYFCVRSSTYSSYVIHKLIESCSSR